MINWFEELLQPGVNLHDNSEGFFSRSLPSREGITLHEKMHGSHLRKLQNDKLKLAYYETKFYKRALTRWLEPVDRNSVIIDLGAGDGRFTELLLDLGFVRIVSTDISRENLASLAAFLKEKGAQDRVTLVQCDANDPVFRDGAFDCVLCIGVLYYLNEGYLEGKKEVSRILRPGGWLIESEPDLEGQALKALIFDGLRSFIDVTQRRRFVETYNGEDFRLRLFDRTEMAASFRDCGLKVVDQHGLSIFPLLMIVAKARKMIGEEEIEENNQEIEDCLDHYDREGDTYKHIIWLAEKGGGEP